MLKIILFLNGDRGISILKFLLKQNIIQILAVVTLKNFKNKFLIKISNSNKLVILKTDNVNSLSFLNKLKKMKSNLFIIGGFPTIFNQKIIDIPKYGVLNAHGGKLPQYRGGSPLNWQIINGEKYFGISVIKINKKIDQGNIITQKKFRIFKKDNIFTLHNKANKYFPILIYDAINKVFKNYSGIKQKDNLSKYWHQRKDKDGKIDLNKMKINEIQNLIRGVTRPYPGAFLYIKNTKIRIFNVSVSKIKTTCKIGTILFIKNNGPYLKCKNGLLLIKSYFIENKNVKLNNNNILK